jgi:hypothetical protein
MKTNDRMEIRCGWADVESDMIGLRSLKANALPE